MSFLDYLMGRPNSGILDIEAQKMFISPPSGTVLYFWGLAGFLCASVGMFCFGWSTRKCPIASLIMGPMHIHSQLISYVMLFCTLHLIGYVYIVGRNSPPYLVGRSVKFGMDLTVCWLALTFRLLHADAGNNMWFLCALVSYTIYIHAIIQLRYNPPDIGFVDLMLHVSIEISVLISGGPCVCLAVLLLSGTTILCRYYFYSPFKGAFQEDKFLVDSDREINADSIVDGDNSGKDKKVSPDARIMSLVFPA